MEDLESNIFTPIPHLDPDDEGFIFLVPNSEIGKFVMPKTQKTTYRDSELPNKVRVDEHNWGDMVFTRKTRGPQGYMAFYFFRDRTKSEIQRPLKTLGFPTNRPHPWPNALVYLGALEDNTQPLTLEMPGAPGGKVTIGRLFERLYKIPEQVISSDIDVEFFVSNTPFPRAMVKTNVPVCGEVRWHDRNIEGSLMCVHPYVEFPEVQAGATRLSGWGTTRVRSPMGGGKRTYKATKPHTTWADHVISVEPSYDEETGLWMLKRETVRVPEGFEAIKDLSY